MRIRVYYEDTDAAGIVYYANYLKFCERARSELFFQNGLSPQSDEGFFVVRKIEADYIGSAELGDLLEVKTALIQKRAASLVLRQEVWRNDEKLFTMKISLAYLSRGRPARMPQSLVSLLKAWESNGSIEESEGV